MAIRCFARRFLVAPYRCPTSSNSAAWPKQSSIRLLTTESVKNDRKGERRRSTRIGKDVGVKIGRENNTAQMVDFFSSRQRWSKMEDMSNKSGTSSLSSIEAEKAFKANDHPLVLDLKRELQSHEAKPSAELVWRLYSAIQIARDSNIHIRIGSDGPSATTANVSQHASLKLPYFVHMRVMRIIRPTRLDDTLKSNTNVNAKEVGQYIERVSKIFRNISDMDPTNFPSARHYNDFLREIAKSGNISFLFSLWSVMTGTSSLDQEEVIRRSRHRRVAEKMTGQTFRQSEPTQDSYDSMIYGVARHLQDQLKRAYKRDIGENRVQGLAEQRKDRAGVISQSTNIAVVQAKKQKFTNVQARQAISLASKRVSQLLQDMLSRDIPLTKFSCDMAMRVMRMSGNLESLKVLTKLSFGVDLDNLDGNSTRENERDGEIPTSFIGNPDVHTMNTVIMSLGELSTVGKMVAAYETLTTPLPRSLHVEENKMPEGSLFATDFRGLFGMNSAEINEEEMQERNLKSNDDTKSLEIVPNTGTMKLLIQHACKPPSPWHLNLQVDLSNYHQNKQVEEHYQREKGVYANLALYFVRDSISRQEDNLKEMIKGLGMKEEELMNLKEFITNEINCLAKPDYAGMPKVKDDLYSTYYRSCMSFLTEGGMKQAEELLALLSKPDQVDESEMPRISEEEKLKLKKIQDLALRNHEIQQKSAMLFIERSQEGILSLLPKIDMTSTDDKPPLPNYKSSSIDIIPKMIHPLISQARQNRKVGLIRSIGGWIERSMALYITEVKVLNVAQAYWSKVFEERKFSKVNEKETIEIKNVLNKIAKRIESIQDKILIELSNSYVQDIRLYISKIGTIRRQRQIRQREVRMQEKQNDLIMAKEEERLRKERKAQRLAVEKERLANHDSFTTNTATVNESEAVLRH